MYHRKCLSLLPALTGKRKSLKLAMSRKRDCIVGTYFFTPSFERLHPVQSVTGPETFTFNNLAEQEKYELTANKCLSEVQQTQWVMKTQFETTFVEHLAYLQTR